MAWFNKSEEIQPPALSLEKQILNSLTAASMEAIVYYDTDFKVLIFNQAAEDLFGLSAEKIVGQRFSLEKARQTSSALFADVMFPSLAPTVVKQSAEGVYPQIIDLSVDEPPRQLRIFLNKVFDDRGQTVGFVKIIHDQTREKELLERQKDFITVAAHQLRTPGTAVNWAFEALSSEQSLSKEIKETVNAGHMAAKNLMKIVNDLLNISQIEEGKFGYQFQEVDLISFFDKLLTEAEPVAKEYNVKIYFDRPKEGIQIMADANKLAIAVSNLIDNAIKYNVPNGEATIKIELLSGESFIKISVKDTGIGVSEEEVKNLFGKFFRADNALQSKVEGSGLGLYITKNVIERHGGKIWVESVLNRGTTFYFTLPTK